MIGPIDYRKYDPQRFAEEHPDDIKLREALEGAQQHAAQIPPQQPGESREDAQNRFDEGMKSYAVEYDNHLDQHHNDQLKQFKDEHYDQQQQEINQKWTDIQENQSDEAKWGSQKQRNQELDQLDAAYVDNFKDSPEYLAKREQLEQMQAARSEAISHEISNVPPVPPMDRDEDRPSNEELTPPPSGNDTPPTANAPQSPPPETPDSSPVTNQTAQTPPATNSPESTRPETPIEVKDSPPPVAKDPQRAPEKANSNPDNSAEYQRHMDAYKLASTPPSQSPSMSPVPSPSNEMER